MIVSIGSADDPRVAAYRDVRERDVVRGRRFIVEGKVTFGRLVEASRFGVESVLIAEGRVEPLADMLAKLPGDVPVYVAPQAAMDGIAGFHIHRGVLAMARREMEQTVEQLVAALPAGPDAEPLTLLSLIGLSNHDNVGACFRNAAALGAEAVLLDGESCDPLYRKSIRVSAGTALALPFARSGTGAGMIAALDAAGIEAWALSPSGGEPLHGLKPPERVAIVLGAEGPGLPGDLMAACRRVSIAMAPGIDSLNVATAGAIALSHVFAARQG
jgi:tRNA G18 (ribose-2'-O)-methylase SpoU